MKYNFTVRERGKGWQIILSYKDETGWHQKSRSGFPKKRDALAARDEMLEELNKDAGTDKSMASITLSEFSGIYLNTRTDLSYNTKLNYRNRIKAMGALKDMPIKKIKYIDIASYFSECPYSAATKEITVSVLSVLLNAAVDYNIISASPITRKIKIMKSRKEKRLRTFTRIEIEDFLSRYKDGETAVIVCILALTGVRVSEALGLKWSDIDFKSMTIHVGGQYGYTEKGRRGFKVVKSKNSNRTIPMPPRLTKILLYYRSHSVRYMDGRLTGIEFVWSVNRYIKRVGGSHSAHDFRHTYATNALSSGADVMTVAALLGDTVNTVIQTYLHYTEDMRENARALVDRMYS